jgi:hypothetical protein
MQTVFLERTLGKQTLNALFLIVTRLSGRAGGWEDCAGVAVECKAECGGSSVFEYATYRELSGETAQQKGEA